MLNKNINVIIIIIIIIIIILYYYCAESTANANYRNSTVCIEI
jgi:multidrug resistance efflux pump